jgi:hypothetical protein
MAAVVQGGEMKSKQLANVLIKILGLSVLIQSIPGIITGLYNAVRVREVGGPGEFWFYPMPSLVLAAIGICLIIKSRDVAGVLFKNEDE